MKKIAIIMRGLSRCGKSFTAREMMRKYGGTNPAEHIFATDDFFVWDVLQERRIKESAGEVVDVEFYDELERDTYRKNWSGSKLHFAHQWNFERFKKAAENGVSPIVCDNTNVAAWEMKNYCQVAKQNGYEIVIQEPTSPWWRDYSLFLTDKDNHGRELEDFARFLAGFHQGLEEKYGIKGNAHGVPLDTFRRLIKKWQPNLTLEDVLGRYSV